MLFKPRITFKAIAEDTNEKDRARKENDQRKWAEHFDRIVVDYFEDRHIPHFHDEFDYVKDKLDCFVPSPGKFKCGGENATPGKKKRKKKAGHVIAPPVPVPEIPASTPESVVEIGVQINA